MFAALVEFYVPVKLVELPAVLFPDDPNNNFYILIKHKNFKQK